MSKELLTKIAFGRTRKIIRRRRPETVKKHPVTPVSKLSKYYGDNQGAKGFLGHFRHKTEGMTDFIKPSAKVPKFGKDTKIIEIADWSAKNSRFSSNNEYTNYINKIVSVRTIEILKKISNETEIDVSEKLTKYVNTSRKKQIFMKQIEKQIGHLILGPIALKYLSQSVEVFINRAIFRSTLS